MTIETVIFAVYGAVAYVEGVIGVKLNSANLLLAAAVLHIVAAVGVYCWNSNALRNWMSAILGKYTCSMSVVASEARDVRDYVIQNCGPGNPEAFMRCVEDYKFEKNYARLMDIGREKGMLIDQLISDCDPSVVVEMGGFFGYSSIRMARLLKKPGAKVYTMEFNTECCKVMRQLISLCKLDDRIKVIEGPAEQSIGKLRKLGVKKVDFVVLDHWKPLYVPDLKALEKTGLMRKDATVFADNMIYPGNRTYIEYIVNSPLYETTMHTMKLGGEDVNPTVYSKMDMVAVSTYRNPEQK